MSEPVVKTIIHEIKFPIFMETVFRIRIDGASEQDLMIKGSLFSNKTVTIAVGGKEYLVSRKALIAALQMYE